MCQEQTPCPPRHPPPFPSVLSTVLSGPEEPSSLFSSQQVSDCPRRQV